MSSSIMAKHLTQYASIYRYWLHPNDTTIVRHNTFSKELSYTKKEIEDLHKLLYENGDIDFIHEIKSRYKDHV